MNKRKESEVFLKFPKAAQIHLRQNSGIQKKKCIKTKNSASWRNSTWALTDSNRRPSACKADAL
ncbi:hypothetical protein, partial [Phocaeicola coprophilus]|uniref:hypothetical protein n=1 Tax=Phocaeicola coprophilus TaxID=387090 RepID=UPI00241CF7D7